MTYLITFIALIIFVLFMSISMIFKKKPISGSCGGLNNALLNKDGKCNTCGTKVDPNIHKKLNSHN